MTDFLVFMAAPLTACFVMVGIHVYLGIHVLEREVIFVDLSLAQIAAVGSTLAFLAGYDHEHPFAYVASLGATFSGAAIFSFTRTRSNRIPQEAIIGIVYAVSAAAVILAMDRAPHGAEQIKNMLVGSVLWVTWPEILKLAGIYLVVGFFHWVMRERFLTLTFRPSDAEQNNWAVRSWDFVFYASFGFVITSSVPIAGVLLVFSFLIVPTVCGALFSDSLPKRLAIGWIVGFLASALGCALSYQADLPTGATIVCVFGGTLVLLGVYKALTPNTSTRRVL